MNHADFKLENYRRFFVFGCSFTNYKWPTWADILYNQAQHLEYYNYGLGGAGNLQIMTKLSHANQKFKFNKNDLIGVMFTSFNREDRWINGSWLSLGNIYNQNVYPEDWVMNFADPTGYIIRDMAVIDMTTNYLKNLSCDSFVLASYPLDDSLENIAGQFEKNMVEQLYKNYDALIKSIPVYHGLIQDLKDQNIGHRYHNTDGKFFHDTHPTPTEHLKYMRASGFNLGPSADQYADKKTKELLTLTLMKDIINIRPTSLSNREENKI